MQHIIQHKDFLPNNLIYGFLGSHPDIFIHKYRDHEDAVENRKKVIKILGSDHISMSLLKQVHGINCAEIESFEDINYNYEGDAQVTRNNKVILAVHTADCVPILLVDQNIGIVGAVHAGWKGAFSGVINSTLQAMQKAGADKDNMVAIIGPCIRQSSYEVDKNFRNKFLLKDMKNTKFFQSNTENKEKYFFDLPEYVKNLLNKAFIKKIYDMKIDTLTYPDFFSYRQACLSQKKLEGYNLSFIGLK
ncbi:MAG: peptidoglycan editing factor PgeF [Rickettsiales bacterium]|nr:peptidoglycan editing factor PgeF [Rickettsiales bacterium]